VLEQGGVGGEVGARLEALDPGREQHGERQIHVDEVEQDVVVEPRDAAPEGQIEVRHQSELQDLRFDPVELVVPRDLVEGKDPALAVGLVAQPVELTVPL